MIEEMPQPFCCQCGNDHRQTLPNRRYCTDIIESWVIDDRGFLVFDQLEDFLDNTHEHVRWQCAECGAPVEPETERWLKGETGFGKEAA